MSNGTKMHISDFLVNGYKSSIIFCGFLQKSLDSVLFSGDGWVTPNILIFFGLRYGTKTFKTNFKWRKCKTFEPLMKGNIKMQSSASF